MSFHDKKVENIEKRTKMSFHDKTKKKVISWRRGRGCVEINK